MPVSRPEPVEIQASAMDNLRYIRQTMERAGSFTAVPGIGGVLMGTIAMLAAWAAGPSLGSARWLTVWLAAAAVAVAVGAAGAAIKSRRARLPLLSGPGRKFLAGFIPAMLAGAVLTAALISRGEATLLPALWLLLYGAAVFSGGSASVRIVPLMGACFMAAGAVALLLPATAETIALAAGFGGLHIVFGTIIAVKYGG